MSAPGSNLDIFGRGDAAIPVRYASNRWGNRFVIELRRLPQLGDLIGAS
jgi:hypothetical protein